MEGDDDDYDRLIALAEAVEKRRRLTQPGLQFHRGSADPVRNKEVEKRSKIHLQESAQEMQIVERYSNLKVKSPTFPGIVLRERLDQMRFIRLGDVQRVLKGGSGSQAWATIGAVDKAPQRRTSSNDNVYSVLTLTDLDGGSLSVFLFGQAHQDHRGLTEGCLVALMNPKVKAGDKSPMVSVSSEEGLIKLGTAADFGRCKSRRQNGGICGNAINVSRAAYCDYHVAGELRKMRSAHRGALLDNTLQTGLRPLQPAASHPGKRLPSQASQGSHIKGPGTDLQKLADALPVSQRVRQLAEAAVRPSAAKAEQETLRCKSQGEGPQENSSRQYNTVGTRVLGPNVNAGNLRQIDDCRMGGSTAIAPKKGSTVITPKGGSGAGGKGKGQTSVKERLLAKLGMSSTMRKAAPKTLPINAPPKAKHPGISDFAAAFSSAAREEGKDAPAGARAGSRYVQLVEDAEHEQLMSALSSLQKKDELAQRLEAITKLQVTAFQCHTCGLVTEKRRAGCQGHHVTQVSALKRWWACEHCGARSATVGLRYPKNRCVKCRDPTLSFKPVSMGRPVKETAIGPTQVADRAHFLPRGQEHAFSLNS
eukprot:jgi/Botrbrau1/2085/Bobra.0047s0046.2